MARIKTLERGFEFDHHHHVIEQLLPLCVICLLISQNIDGSQNDEQFVNLFIIRTCLAKCMLNCLCTQKNIHNYSLLDLILLFLSLVSAVDMDYTGSKDNNCSDRMCIQFKNISCTLEGEGQIKSHNATTHCLQHWKLKSGLHCTFYRSWSTATNEYCQQQQYHNLFI